MKRSRAYQRSSHILFAALTVLAGAPLFIEVTVPAAYAQSPATLSNQQLDSLTAPIALYPDALLAQVLMASTFPQDVPAAAAWSKANPNLKGDDAVKAVGSQPWDPSVQSLVAFPQVLATMASKPDWVTQLGNAFLAQPNDVMDSVQRLRKQAQKAGNLQTNQQQKVIVEQNTVQIVPVNPQVVYVPTYNPTVVYGAWPYPAYPPVYVPPPPGYAVASGLAAGLAFGVGVAITSSLWSNVNWNNHSVNINVNQYNNINVNHRLDVNSSTTNWNRNANVNRNTNANISGAQRDAYRGRDTSASRAQAQQTLQNRTGQNMGGTASERLQGIQHGGDNAGNIRNSAQNANRDNALRGAGNGGETQRDTQRGQASRQSMANNGGGFGSNGGGQQRGGNLGAGGGGQQRGGGFASGGGGGGGRLGAGGGGQRGGGGGRHFAR
ncbi:hypothetical protein A6V36_25565 [Paraburkholderia ginsengiterrae]|uniref:DUF3300 domain-containing protein n=1 Tax=Paraburkholderia ginsengiterrae TaxID=1462993 RepID=A0A1A9NAM3_9BURK|nr:DUF3300 domain-containing protein [Paraburkholderia ginsengiterrae]OAJ60076.1 hypothetical protein A6V36_25565 [Paraburkholderia ginsengiterrae]OAJ63209.1 hypothetical protein A6V37_21400 [Paraburkholderia ginsengiterrae]